MPTYMCHFHLLKRNVTKFGLFFSGHVIYTLCTMTRAILPSKYTKYKVLIFFFLRARIVITNYTYKAPPTDIYSFEVLWEECHLIHFFFVPFNFTVFPFVFRK